MTAPAPGAVSTMLLLTDGSVIGQQDFDRPWFRLRPDGTGSYSNGTWSAIAPMHDTRLYYASAVMLDGRVFVAGGEDGTGTNTVEIYDPRTDVWTRAAAAPGGDVGDSAATVLPDGRVLVLLRSEVGAAIFAPATGSWTSTATKLFNDRNDEESVAQLPDGTFLSACVFAPPAAQKYIPSLDTWVSAGAVPVSLVDSAFEIGPAVTLYDGRALLLGATGNTALYTTPANPSDPGSWQAGPPIPRGMAADDVPGAVMPNGRVLFAASSGLWNAPNAMFEYDPSTDTIVDAPSPPSLPSFTTGSVFVNRMLLLPTGQVLMSDGGGHLALYTPSGSPDPSWKPAVTSVVDHGDGSFLVSGTQLSGRTEGSYYGDDAQAATNYPIARLVGADSVVHYGRTYGTSSNRIGPGSASSTLLRVPGVPAGSYALTIVGSAVASDSVTLTVTASAAACNDGVRGGNETAIDCGGSCVPCADGQTCAVAGDCEGGICKAGLCATPNCSDGAQNGNETDVDCGGPTCAGCVLGLRCHASSDCAQGQGLCLLGRCTNAYCHDGQHDYDETGVDCGGPNCPRCAVGQGCGTSDDCAAGQGQCIANVCSKAYCSDNTQDYDEQDTDCGGPNCPGCLVGQRCRASSDCGPHQGLCLLGRCLIAYCSDGHQDYDETGVDCGGPNCPACAVGQTCFAPSDCAVGQGQCIANVCSKDYCSDGVHDYDEGAIDCGGPSCPACTGAINCNTASDCAPGQGVCLLGHCMTAYCSDGHQDYDETGPDCGGPNCKHCAGGGCQASSDCAAGQGQCIANVCSKDYCSDGVRDYDEAAIDCGGPSCKHCLGAACQASSDCAAGQGQCIANVCSKDYCSDGVHDYDEGAIDCGGPNCPACTGAINCHTSSDCAPGQGLCLLGRCMTVYCSDGHQDYDETGSDCGGPNCPACNVGQHCQISRDCAAGQGQCIANVCSKDYCSDGVHDYDEGAIDCGGPNCAACTGAINCHTSSDCAPGQGLCLLGRCMTVYCSDGHQDYDETGSDCGGPNCKHCAGAACQTSSDCAAGQGLCIANVCSKDYCSDGVRDYDEAAIDCGGPSCKHCLGAACQASSDCAAGQGQCIANVCSKDYCSDGVHDYDEGAIDCGGPNCAACTGAVDCHTSSDCAPGQGVCLLGRCMTSYCRDGHQDYDETAIDCGGPNCTPCDAGAACVLARDCRSGSCQASVCQ
jgi:hypothetical protein